MEVCLYRSFGKDYLTYLGLVAYHCLREWEVEALSLTAGVSPPSVLISEIFEELLEYNIEVDIDGVDTVHYMPTILTHQFLQMCTIEGGNFNILLLDKKCSTRKYQETTYVGVHSLGRLQKCAHMASILVILILRDNAKHNNNNKNINDQRKVRIDDNKN